MIKQTIKYGIIFMLGLIIGSLFFVSSEVKYGYDDNGAFFLFNRILPSQSITALMNTGLINNYYVDTLDKTTQFWYNLSNSQGLTENQVKKYLSLYDNKFSRYDISLNPDLAPNEPYDCRRSDINASKIFGYYTLDDGTDFVNPNDAFCLEVLNG